MRHAGVSSPLAAPVKRRSNADFSRESIGIRQKTSGIAPSSLPVALKGDAGGDFPGDRHESPPDERRLVLISPRPAAYNPCSD